MALPPRKKKGEFELPADLRPKERFAKVGMIRHRGTIRLSDLADVTPFAPGDPNDGDVLTWDTGFNRAEWAAPTGGVGSGGFVPFYVIGDIPGTTGKTHPLRISPANARSVTPFLNGTALELVNGNPSGNTTFSVEDGYVLTGRSVAAGDHFLIDYAASVSTDVFSDEILTTGFSHLLAFEPVDVDSVLIYLNGALLQKVGSSPNTVQYTLTQDMLTTGQSIAAGDHLIARYAPTVPSQTIHLLETIVTTGTSHSLSATPADQTQAGLYLNGGRMERAGTPISNMQYSLSVGGAITTFRSIIANDHLVSSFIS